MMNKKTTPREPHGSLSTITGEQLHAYRMRLDLTQSKLGHLLGITKTEIYRKEKNRRHITQNQYWAMIGIMAVAGALNKEDAQEALAIIKKSLRKTCDSV